MRVVMTMLEWKILPIAGVVSLLSMVMVKLEWKVFPIAIEALVLLSFIAV